MPLHAVGRVDAGLTGVALRGDSTHAVELRLRNSGSVEIAYNRGIAPGRLVSARQGANACRAEGVEWRCGPVPVAAGEPFVVSLTTEGVLTSGDGPFQVYASENGWTESGPYAIPWQGSPPPPPAPPSPPPPPPPPQASCLCEALRVTAPGFTTGASDRLGRTRVTMALRWSLTCSGGKGGCHGEFALQPPRGAGLVGAGLGRAVRCSGSCAGTTTRLLHVSLLSKSLSRERRRDRRFTFRVDRFCMQGDRRLTLGPTPLTLVFDARGKLDLRGSDLNGDGRPDGR